MNLELAREAVALLRNDGGLPFDAAPAEAIPGSGDAPARKRIAVVGPLADDAQNQLGDWAGSSGQVGWMPDGHPRGMITTVLDGFRALAGDGCEVTYARGANVIDLVPDPEGEFYPDGQPRPKIGVSAPVDRALLDEAVAAAREADLIVAVVGDVVQLVGETCSTATLELLGGQNALLDALADVSRETGKPMVTVLVSSKPQVLPRSIVGDSGVLAGRCNDPKSGAGSILWAPNPGMEGGQAIAEIILGEVNPSGRLPITFPCHAGQLPVYYNQIRGQHGNRYADLTQDPAFAFGEGEGYTTFAYGEPTIVGGASNADGTFAQTDTVHAEIALTNTGAPRGHRGRAGVRGRRRHLIQLGRPRTQGVPPRHARTGRDRDRRVRHSGLRLHHRRRRCEPHRRTRRVRAAHRPLVAPRRPQAHHLHRRVNLLCVRCSRVSRSRVNRFRVGLICFRPLRSYAGAGGVVCAERSNDAEY